MQHLNSKQILNIIQKYITNPQSDQAILIDGEWGCGKTYFIKKSVQPAIKECGKVPIYISLYGITDTKEIENQIYLQIIDSLFPESKPMKIIKTGGKIILEGYSMLKSTIENKAEVTLPEIAESNIINITKLLTNLGNYILIFDDLERCNLQPNIILGYINNFVEQREWKCIIVANQKEMARTTLFTNQEQKLLLATMNTIQYTEESSKNKDIKNRQIVSIPELYERAELLFNKNNEYKQIKEKLIGYTLYYEVDFNEVFDNILKNNRLSEDTKVILKKYKNKVIRILKDKNHFNIRTLKSAVQHFDEIINYIKSMNIDNDTDYEDAILKVLERTIRLNIVFRTGKEEKNYIEYNKLKINMSDDIIFESITKLIEQGFLDKEKFSDEITMLIEKIKFENKNPEDPLNRLDRLLWLEDEEVIVYTKKLIKKLKNNSYNFKFYRNILRLLIIIKNIGFDKKYFEEGVLYMKDNLKKSNNILKQDFKLLDITFEKREDRKLYESTIHEFLEIIKDNSDNNTLLKLKESLNYKQNWAYEFYKNSSRNISRATLDKSFLNSSDVDKIIVLLDKSNNKDINYFSMGISTIYNFASKKLVKQDIHSLKKLSEGLSRLLKNNYEIMKKLNIEILEKIINDLISDVLGKDA